MQSRPFWRHSNLCSFDIHICWFNFDVLALGSAYKPTGTDKLLWTEWGLNSLPPDWGNTARCQLSRSLAPCHWNCVKKHNPNDLPVAALDNWNAQVSISTLHAFTIVRTLTHLYTLWNFIWYWMQNYFMIFLDSKLCYFEYSVQSKWFKSFHFRSCNLGGHIPLNQLRARGGSDYFLGPLLLTWFNFNSSMDK